MKIVLPIAVFLLISIVAKSQPYLSITANTRGAGVAAGYLETQSGIELKAGCNAAPFDAAIPMLFYICFGKQFLITHKEEDNFSLTGSVGYADYTAKEFIAASKEVPAGAARDMKELKAFYNLEIGKDWYLGRLYINASYCGGAFYGIGIKAFIK